MFSFQYWYSILVVYIRIWRIKIEKILIYFILLFLSSSLYLTDKFNSLGSVMISAMVLLIVPIILLSGKSKFKANPTSLFIMGLYLLACGFSAIHNTDLSLLFSAAMLFILYIAALVIIPAMGVNVNKLVFRALFISHLPIIVIPLGLSGLNTSPYRGIFYNPNSLGSVAATLFIAFFALYTYKLEESLANKVKFRQGVIYLIALFLLLFLIILSGSRTSLLAVMITVLIGTFFLSVRLIKVRRFWATLLKTAVFTMIGGVFLFLLIRLTPVYTYFYNNILYKFELKLARGDVLDQRSLSWSQTIREAGLFGQGSDYFNTRTVVAAHNTFINILGETGWVSLIFFGIFLVYVFLRPIDML